MAASRKKPVLATIKNVRLLFRNFDGKPGRYNKKGERSFSAGIDPETAEQLRADGWNVKVREPRDPDDDPLYYLPVKVNFENIPPKVVVVTSKKQRYLSEDLVGMLDWAEIEKADVVLNAYDWSVDGNHGRTAYLKTLYATIFEDELSEDYADIPFDGDDDRPF